MTVVRCPAKHLNTVDGDTYDLLVNFKARNDQRDAQVCRVRLLDYSARELRQPAEYATDGTLVRHSGADARSIADQELRESTWIEVEFKGDDSFGRDVCWIWDESESFGAKLLARRAVIAARQVG